MENKLIKMERFNCENILYVKEENCFKADYKDVDTNIKMKDYEEREVKQKINNKTEFGFKDNGIKEEVEFKDIDIKEENYNDVKADHKDLDIQDVNYKDVNLGKEEVNFMECEVEIQEQAQNPWPHLDSYYLFKAREGDKLIFNCKLCLPKTVPIKGHITSLSNLKQHIKRTHLDKFILFEETVKAGSTRGKARHRFSSDSGSSTSVLSSVVSPPAAKKARKQANGELFGMAASGSGVPQIVVDQRIVDLFVANMLPLHVVESDTFEKLIKTLNPSKSSISRRTLCRRIVNLHTDVKQHLIKVLGDLQWVATTADCWYVHKNSYLSLTVHWVDPTTRQRHHALLGCIRLTDNHTYDVIAQTMLKVYSEFHIEKKITRTTIDNGRNFAEAFVQFGVETDTLPELPVVQDIKADSDGDAEAALLDRSLDEQELEYVSLADSLTVPVAELDDVDTILDNLIKLPVHMRCAAHTFNLVASNDADAAIQSAVFKEPYRAAMAKARALWNLQDRITLAADSIYAEVGIRLVVPNTTRWNSTYDSVILLNTILETKRPAFQRVMTQLKVDCFNDQDVDFMKEYAKVMSPVAKALDKIQGEDQAYLGTLLPTVAATVCILKNLKLKGLIYCNPLVDALLAGIDKRFGLLLDDEECQLAAAFHPRFRLIWLEKYDNTKVAKVRKSMESKVEMVMRQQSEVSSNNEEEEDDFFSAVTQPKESNRSQMSLKDKAQNLVKTWLETSSKDLRTDAAFLGEQVLVDLFIKFNTAIPSSAALERLFSMEKDILRANRTSVTDETFDMLIFIKSNMHLIDKMENEKNFFRPLYQ